MSSWVPHSIGQPSGRRWCGGVGEPGVGGGVFDGGDQIEEADAVGRGHDRVLVGGVDAVEADDGVEVDDPASLHFGDLPVGQADGRGVDAALFGDPARGAVEGDARAAPEFAGGMIPDDLMGVVVAVEAERDAEGILVFVVDSVASQVEAVRA